MQALRRSVNLLKLLHAAVTVVKNPDRLDEVIGIADGIAKTERPIMEAMAEELGKTPEGAAALATKPRVGLLDLKTLEALPEGTFGRAVARYLTERNLNPADLPQREANDALEYLQAHFYETHDLWHVVTGFDTDVAGELGLQAFYAAQVPGKLPVALLSLGMLNTLLYAFSDRSRRLDAIAQGWRLGRAAKNFFGQPWSNWFALPLEEVRARMNVVPVSVARA